MIRTLFCVVLLGLLMCCTQVTPVTYIYAPHSYDIYVSFAPEVINRMLLDKVRVVVYGMNSMVSSLREVFGQTKTVKAPLASLSASDWTDGDVSLNKYKSYVGTDGYLKVTLTDDQLKEYLLIELQTSMNAMSLQPCTYGPETNDMTQYSCYYSYALDADKLLDTNRHAFWNDTLTRALYNIIANNEIYNPRSTHICLGSPRDCDESGIAEPEYLACWYAMRQLMTDVPNGVGGPWTSEVYLAKAPFFINETTPSTPDTASLKLNQMYPSTAPLGYNPGVTLDRKQSPGLPLRLFDPDSGKYALNYHASKIEFLSTYVNPNVYKEQSITTYYSTNYIGLVCPLDAGVTEPPVIKGVLGSYAITGYPPFPPAVVMNVGAWVGLGFFLTFCVISTLVALLKFCLSTSSSDSPYKQM